MKPTFFRFLFLLSFIATFLISSAVKAQKVKPFMATVAMHKQLYNSSCIPSSIEMVLKYQNKVGANYFDLQNAWKEKWDGTFSNFDGKTINGIKFKQQFKNPRNANFPLKDLFKAISGELANGRKVIISLISGQNMWHIYVIDSENKKGDFIAFSRAYNVTTPLVITNVKDIVKSMQGTDIITYSVL